MAEPYNFNGESVDPVVEVELSGDESDSDSGSDYEDDGPPTPAEEEEEGDEYIPIAPSPRVPVNHVPSRSSRVLSVNVEGERTKRRRGEEGRVAAAVAAEVCSPSSQGSQWNRVEIDGLFCSICMEAWTSEGDHHICCLPCGHLFGLSCINKWLRQKRSSGKCPQCNRKCTLKEVRKLFAPRIAVVDEESRKRIHFLETKCASLEKKDAEWSKIEALWHKKESELQQKIKQLVERTVQMQRSLDNFNNTVAGLYTARRGHHVPFIPDNTATSNFSMQGSSGSFELQEELYVEGARLFDINISSQTVLVARRAPKVGGCHFTKISLMPPHGTSEIFHPLSTNIIKDLHFCPRNTSLVLFASLGKKLSILSLESNNISLSYDLPCAAWSCSWDINSPHHVYAGLQNGMLLEFDTRQTAKPLESRSGLSNNPIHTVHSLPYNGTLPIGARTVLSASSIGICQWNFEAAEERPSLVPTSGNQGVCISLAHCPTTENIVASYRPKVETLPSCEVAATGSQAFVSHSSQAIGQGIQGSHLHLKRTGSSYETLGSASATVSNIRLPRCTIICRKQEQLQQQQPCLFVSGDEAAQGLLLQELPSFAFNQRLQSSRKSFISDVKYASSANIQGGGVLGCLSESTLQLFTTRR
ncbi:unnamed protein product [Linum tenue]|uniref:RING-type E3 ubiquitin transferase n=1 Tax=Linum tenue TaxID=586396 RepID=A0AAV0PLR3_9ROSI|nr:unnamed protein product [Linum tenue]